MIDVTSVEGFKPTLRELTERDIDELALDALNMAIATIQHHLGVTSGDIAGIFFSNGIVEHQLRNYVTTELEQGGRA